MKRNIFLLALTLMSATAFAQTDLPALIDKMSPAIFKIITYDATGNEYAEGTGFFTTSHGEAITNYHVMQGASKAKIKTADNKTYLVDNIISWSKESDLLKFSVKNELNEEFPFVKLTSATPKSGEHIFIIGNPEGLEKSVADGIVSSVRQDPDYGEVIQITAPISHGNSGSPLMNMNGEAYGVVCFFLSEGQNLNFAVSVKNLNVMDPVNALRFPSENGQEEVSDYGNDNHDDNTQNNNNYNNNSGTGGLHGQFNGSSTDNGTTGSSSGTDYNDPSSTFYYMDSKIQFCTELDDNQRPSNPGDLFYVAKSGSYVYVWVSNNEKRLATDELTMYIYKKKGKDYNDLRDTKYYTVTPDWTDTHIQYTFYDAGDYLIDVYNKEGVWINDAYVTIKLD